MSAKNRAVFLLCATLVLSLWASPASAHWPFGRHCGWRFSCRGLGFPLYSRHDTPPYFACFPPVYYRMSYDVAQRRGCGPTGCCESAVRPAPLLVKNPYVSPTAGDVANIGAAERPPRVRNSYVASTLTTPSQR